MERTRSKTKQRVPAAKAGDVLGNTAPETRIDPKWQRHFQNLTELREQLLRQKEDMIRDVREEKPAFSLHIADAATDQFDSDLALSLISAEQDALYEVEQALNRIKNGNYGICELTGKPIEPERLNFVPWTRFSAEAEKRLETKGAIHRTRLGKLETVPKSGPAPEEQEED